MIVRPLDKNPLSKSNQILTHVIDLVNSTYVNWKNGYVMCVCVYTIVVVVVLKAKRTSTFVT